MLRDRASAVASRVEAAGVGGGEGGADRGEAAADDEPLDLNVGVTPGRGDGTGEHDCPLGKKAAAPPCELAVIAAGVSAASAWPAGLNSARAGKTKMSPAASRPSAVMLPRVADSTFPPLPKEESRSAAGTAAGAIAGIYPAARVSPTEALRTI
jgi:hypothetical protein